MTEPKFTPYTAESVFKAAIKELHTRGSGQVRATDAVVAAVMTKPKNTPFLLREIPVSAGNPNAVARSMACVGVKVGKSSHGKSVELTRTFSPFESGSAACPTTCRRRKAFCIAYSRVRLNEGNAPRTKCF